MIRRQVLFPEWMDAATEKLAEMSDSSYNDLVRMHLGLFTIKLIQDAYGFKSNRDMWADFIDALKKCEPIFLKGETGEWMTTRHRLMADIMFECRKAIEWRAKCMEYGSCYVDKNGNCKANCHSKKNGKKQPTKL